MNDVLNFFSEYGVITLAVVAITSAAEVLFNAFAKDKLPRGIKQAVFTALSVVLCVAGDMLFIERAFKFNVGAIYTGVICGSLSVAVTAFIEKAKNGNATAADFTALAAEILDGFIDGERKVIAIELLFNALLDGANGDAPERLEKILKSCAKGAISDDDAKRLAEKLINAAKFADKSGK